LSVVGNKLPILDSKADIENADTISELNRERGCRGLTLRDGPTIKGHTTEGQCDKHSQQWKNVRVVGTCTQQSDYL